MSLPADEVVRGPTSPRRLTTVTEDFVGIRFRPGGCRSRLPLRADGNSRLPVDRGAASGGRADRGATGVSCNRRTATAQSGSPQLCSSAWRSRPYRMSAEPAHRPPRVTYAIPRPVLAGEDARTVARR